MKLRVLICLFLLLIVISDVTAVAATNAANVTTVVATNIGAKTMPFEYIVTITMHGHARCFSVPGTTLRAPVGHVNIDGNQFRFNRTLSASWWTEAPIRNIFSFVVNRGINTIYLGYTHGLARRWQPPCCDDPAGHFVYRKTRVISEPLRFPGFRIYRNNTLLAYGFGLGTHTVNLPSPPILINESHALNFTLAAAMAIPTMTVDIVDDIMLIIGRHIKCGIAKFAIRAALLKFAAKGVAIATAITAVGYLFSEFADDIYEAIFINIPEINPGDTHFHEIHLHDVMNVIDTYYPLFPHIRNDVEESIRLFIDEHGLISITGVMEIIRNHQNNTVIDIYQETPEILPENIVINRYQVPEIMDMIDEYFPVELPIRNIIEEEIYRRIDDDEFNEIPFSEVIDIIEEEQNIFIPEIPTETPEEHQEYIDNIIDRIVHEDPYIPTIPATPCIFQGIPATPIIPRTPTRPKEEIHTFPFYSLFVDPLASVIGITLAHLFAAMMIIGTIISIAASWGSIGAILGGFVGTIITSYFGLTSWLIPLYLVVIFIIYLNIKIRKGSVGE